MNDTLMLVVTVSPLSKDKAIAHLTEIGMPPLRIEEYGNRVGLFYDYSTDWHPIYDALEKINIWPHVFNNTNWKISAK